MTLRRLDSSMEVQMAPPQPPHPDYFLYKKTNFPLHPTNESNSEVTHLFSLIGLFAGTLLNVNFAKGVCVSVILASCSDWFPCVVCVIHHLMSDVIDLNACPPFSTFQRAASTLTFESFYELPFVLNCQLHIKKSGVERWFCVCVCVDGRGCMYCMCFSFGTWCHRCVARYRRVTALELTDESTEPDPGIASGCKPLTLTLLLGDVLYTLCSFVFLLYSCAISCNLVTCLFSTHL